MPFFTKLLITKNVLYTIENPYWILLKQWQTNYFVIIIIVCSFDELFFFVNSGRPDTSLVVNS